MSKKDNRNSGKKEGFFKSLTSALDEVINEVKADVKAMTPPDQPDPRKLREEKEKQAKLDALVKEGRRGVAETEVEGAEPEIDTERLAEEVNKPQAKALPTGNLWQALKNPEVTGRLHGDVCYHALTVADVEQYLKAVTQQKEAPFTLGIVAINIPAMADDEDAEGADDDMLTASLMGALEKQPRLYGAVGAGPRQLWSNMLKLDEKLSHLLNEHPKLVALGPLGIDEPFAPYTLSQQEQQLDLQLDIAQDFNLPVLLTHRKSLSHLADVLAQRKGKRLPRLVYLEALTTPEELDLVKRFNMSVVLRPEVTPPEFATQYKALYEEIAEDKLLLGSGSALVAPHGFSGHFNQPKFLHNSLIASCKLLTYSEHKLLSVTNRNLAELFPQA